MTYSSKWWVSDITEHYTGKITVSLSRNSNHHWNFWEAMQQQQINVHWGHILKLSTIGLGLIKTTVLGHTQYDSGTKVP